MELEPLDTVDFCRNRIVHGGRSPQQRRLQAVRAEIFQLWRQMPRFNVAAMLTHPRYGANSHAATGLTAANSRSAQTRESQRAAITNNPAPMLRAPKRTGAHAALSASCVAYATIAAFRA